MDISKHLEKADEAVRRKNFDGAIELYQQLIQIQPTSYDARKGLLAAAAKRYEYKKPMKALLLASAGASLAGGKSMKAMKKWAQAAEQYQKVVILDPTNADWSMSLAESLEGASNNDGALAVYEHLSEVDPKNIEAFKRAGALHYHKGDLVKALGFYEQALAINPRDQESLKARKNLAAEGILQNKGFETATSSRELIKDKEQQKALEQAQRLHKTADEIEGAIESLRNEIQMNPNLRRHWEQLGALLEKKNALEDAIDAYQKALALDPNSFDLKVKIDELGLKRFDRDIEKCKNSTDPAASAQLKALEAQKLEFEVEQTGKRAAEHPTDLGIRFKYGRLLARANKVDEAIGELQKAVVDPRWKLDCFVTLGQCFFKKGLFDLSRKQLEKALELLPSGSARSKEILYNLGLVAEKMGANQDAAGYYSRIYEVDISYKDVATKVEKLRS